MPPVPEKDSSSSVKGAGTNAAKYFNVEIISKIFSRKFKDKPECVELYLGVRSFEVSSFHGFSVSRLAFHFQLCRRINVHYCFVWASTGQRA